ncbi:MAG: type IX secretion system sortase PorU, partial [Salibacteraceae bacterium]
NSQIKGYTNIDALTLYVTATCEFSRFDDPDRTSAGEFTILNPSGSALALLTTTRLVYASENFKLATRFFSNVFEKIDGKRPTLGDLTRLSKVGGSSINTRNFSLLGDPAATLAYPKYSIKTTSAPDTLKSLQEITINGQITDEFGQKISNFNGTIYPTIYAQKRDQNTLNNDGHGVFSFKTQENALFNGKASVSNGDFSFSFIVPKDINFKYGNGKISYYAENGSIDALGSDGKIIIGGLDGDPNSDQIGPEISLWMNDESFITGGLTDENPKILAKVFDESGINTVGNGIGHDITAVIDENTANSITLNEYYESDLDSYKKGVISYNLSNLTEGKHTLRLKVWDVFNNSSEAYTEFVVSNSSSFDITHVLNYPNPFTTNTDFYFDHNAIDQQLTVRIQIFTISGKLVKTIDHIEAPNGYRAGPINWDGRDEYGDRIGKGTYVYKIKATNSFDQTVEKFEKIVIL